MEANKLSESLLECLLKLEAMVEMRLTKDLIDYPSTKLHDYLRVMGDLLSVAKGLNENLIGD